MKKNADKNADKYTDASKGLSSVLNVLGKSQDALATDIAFTTRLDAVVA